MLEGAANGDPSAQDRLERHRLQQKLYMRKKRRTEKALREAGDPGAVARYKEKQAYWRNHEASERAKREAGDPDALARYEARKAGWRRREARRKARGTLSSSHDHAESTAVPTGEQSEDELDVEDEGTWLRDLCSNHADDSMQRTLLATMTSTTRVEVTKSCPLSSGAGSRSIVLARRPQVTQTT